MGKKSINLNRFSMIASLCLLSVFLCITLLAANGEQHTEHRAERKSMLLKMMDSMMTEMDSVSLDASVAGDFLRQMIPHHQGAVEMAEYEIKYGKSPEMIRLARKIVTAQQQEIAEMETMLKNYPYKEGETVPIKYVDAMTKIMMDMMHQTPTDMELKGKDVDCSFAMVMLPHHQAAVDMAMVFLKLEPQSQLVTFAQSIVSDQKKEIEQMQKFIENDCK